MAKASISKWRRCRKLKPRCVVFGLTFLFLTLQSSVSAAIPGGLACDYNANGVCDAADYVLWRNGGPLQNDATPGVQPADYNVWRAGFGRTAGSGAVLSLSSPGQTDVVKLTGAASANISPVAVVPEPNALTLTTAAALAFLARPRRRLSLAVRTN
jgi:hypothetical protein